MIEPGSLTGWEAIIEVVVYNELLSQTGLSTVVELTGSTADVNHQSHQCGLEMVHHYTICGRQESLTQIEGSEFIKQSAMGESASCQPSRDRHLCLQMKAGSGGRP